MQGLPSKFHLLPSLSSRMSTTLAGANAGGTNSPLLLHHGLSVSLAHYHLSTLMHSKMLKIGWTTSNESPPSTIGMTIGRSGMSTLLSRARCTLTMFEDHASLSLKEFRWQLHNNYTSIERKECEGASPCISELETKRECCYVCHRNFSSVSSNRIQPYQRTRRYGSSCTEPKRNCASLVGNPPAIVQEFLHKATTMKWMLHLLWWLGRRTAKLESALVQNTAIVAAFQWGQMWKCPCTVHWMHVKNPTGWN